VEPLLVREHQQHNIRRDVCTICVMQIVIDGCSKLPVHGDRRYFRDERHAAVGNARIQVVLDLIEERLINSWCAVVDEWSSF